MENKFTKEEIQHMIDSQSTHLSKERIKELIRKEAAKPRDEIDTEYFDLCFDLLAMKDIGVVAFDGNNAKPKMLKTSKILILAAVIVTLMVSTFTVSAQALHLNIPYKTAKLVKDNAEIKPNFEAVNTKADGYALLDTELVKEIAEYGISPVTIPEEMVKESCKITKIDNLITDKTISSNIAIYFKYQNNYGYIVISQFVKSIEMIGDETDEDVISGQMININGMDVLIFEHTNYCTIRYNDDLTEYDIYLETDINSAIEFAKSIK